MMKAALVVIAVLFLFPMLSLAQDSTSSQKRDAIGIRAGFGSDACIELSYRHKLAKLFQLEIDGGYQRDKDDDYELYGVSVAVHAYFGLGWLEGFFGFGIQADQYKLAYNDEFKSNATFITQFGVQKDISDLFQLSWDARISKPFIEQYDDVIWNTAIGARLRW